MAKFPFLTRRSGSRNWYYKRDVPPELRGEGRPGQVWRSLKTADRKAAEQAYAKQHAEVEALFESWRREDNQPSRALVGTVVAPVPGSVPVAPLTPALLRRLADAHYLNTYEADFGWRGSLWQQVHKDEQAFWRGEIIRHPKDDWHQVKGQALSYYAYLMEEPVLEDVFLYCVFMARKERLNQLKRQYQLGDSRAHEEIADDLLSAKQLRLNSSDGPRLCRKLMEAEIRALEDIAAGDEVTFDGILDRQASSVVSESSSALASPAEAMSILVEKYLDEVGRQREWPEKTVLRKRGELREFLVIVGDKPVNRYRQEDGVKFKDTQLALPVNRQQPPFKGLPLVQAANTASDLRRNGETIELLSPITIKDKIGTVSLFFAWAKTRDASVVDPVEDQAISLPRNRRGKKRHPWAIEELNKMFSAPIFVGCESEHRWKRPGQVILRQSAMFWVPLIALFSGMRLGEIIQMQVGDVKALDGIQFFDVTPVTFDSDDQEGEDADGDEEKSLKTLSSRRGVPIHDTLFDLGFGEFLEDRRASGALRIFPDYEKARDDGSWSKQFSKHFKRFRDSIGVTRRGVKFHSLRHNVEDALRNADVRKEIRDAVQGHGENGVSREYGSGYYVTTLNEAVQKIRYVGLVLPSKP